MVECSVVAAEVQPQAASHSPCRLQSPNHAPIFPFNHVYPTPPSPGPPDVSYNSFMTILADVPQFAALLFSGVVGHGSSDLVTWRRLIARGGLLCIRF
jgi:hypothetical protein